MGPWLHRTDNEEVGSLRFPDALGGGIDRAKSFFDRWLRGVETPEELDRPAITYFEMAPTADVAWRGRWRSAPSWPPPGSSERRFYLDPAADALASRPPAAAASDRYRYDPADPLPTPGGHVLTPTLPSGPRDLAPIESRADVVVYTTAPLEAAVTLAGRPRVELWFESDRPDTDVTAFLAHVDRNGRSILLGEGVLRLRFRESTAHETPAAPGKTYRVEVELDHLAMRLTPGDRLRLVLSSSNYPKYAKNLNDGAAMYRDGDGLVATNQVWGGAERPSALVLPIVDG
jgi:hypothetical protein